jgi:hypothetical protein
MVRFRRETIFVVGFWWLGDILSTSLTNLVCPKSLTILPLVCLDHYPQLRLMTRQPTHQLSQLIILILQKINIMSKFQILQSMQFTGRERCRNWFFQLSLKRNSVSILSLTGRARSYTVSLEAKLNEPIPTSCSTYELHALKNLELAHYVDRL